MDWILYVDNLGLQHSCGFGMAVIKAQPTVEVLHEVGILPLQCLLSHPLPAFSSPSSGTRALDLGGFLTKGTLLIFDEFFDRENEFKAFMDWRRIYRKNNRIVGGVDHL